MNITFPDGSVKQYEDGMTALQIAESISPRLRKATLAAEIDGSRADAFRPISGDHSIKLLTWEDEDGRWTMRHTAAHILAQAVKRVHPEAKLAIGPAIDTGFYYDFDAEPFTPEDLEQIQKEMEKIIAEALPLERFEMPRADAIKYFEEKGEPYKVELIQDLPEDAIISFYRQGDFTDLCAGPHVENTGKVKFVKLMSVAGAYWRGSEANPMLQRIYGAAFATKEDLKAYQTRLEEAAKRDHRKLGAEMDLFSFPDEIGPGLAVFHPKGAAVINAMEDYSREMHRKHHYSFVQTPHITKGGLYETSGHLQWYKDSMYPPMRLDEEKDENGNVTEVYCTVDMDSLSGSEGADRKIKGKTLHWVSAADAVPFEARLYDPLLADDSALEDEAEPTAEDAVDAEETEEAEEADANLSRADYDFLKKLNQHSLTVVRGVIEPYAKECAPGTALQFLRTGYFCKDPDSTAELPVFNRTVGLRDAFAKAAK